MTTQRVQLTPEHALVRGRTGRAVTVAVIDSGVNPRNPHIGRIADAVAFADDGAQLDDVLDRLGHGTAVTAAIQEKVPDADVHIVKVFHNALSTTSHAIAGAIDWASAHGSRLINLSLGTVKPHSIAVLTDAVQRAHERGAIVVSAREHEGEAWYPGSIPLVAGVALDWTCAREAIWIERTGPTITFGGSGFPRPVPGLAPERNIRGVSFAVANVTGVLARALEDRSEVRSVENLMALLSADG